jgi:hypothetical protein
VFGKAGAQRFVSSTCQDILECQFNVAGIEGRGLDKGQIVFAYKAPILLATTTFLFLLPGEKIN